MTKTKRNMLTRKIAPDHKGYVHVYTDAGRKKYKCGTILSSIAVYFGPGENANIGKIVPSVSDINVAEAMATLEAIKIARKNKINKLTIFTDSLSTVHIVNSLKSQRRGLRGANKYRRKPEKKLKLFEKSPSTFQYIVDQINQMEDVQFIWVKAHSKPGVPGHKGNKAADKLAGQALKRAAANAGLR